MPKKLLIAPGKWDEKESKEITNLLERIKDSIKKENRKVKCICGLERNILNIEVHFTSIECSEKRKRLNITIFDSWFFSELKKLISKWQNIDTEDEKEEWRDLDREFRKEKNIKNMYEVSTFGRVCNSLSKRIFESKANKYHGYHQIELVTNEKRGRVVVLIHVLIARTFLRIMEGRPEVDHIDRIRDDNRSCNLRWVTRSENLLNRGKRKRKTIIQYDEKWEFIKEWQDAKEVEKKLKISGQSILKACKDGINVGDHYWKYSEDASTDLDGEEWKEIPDIPKCFVSNKGRVCGLSGRKTFGSSLSGYRTINLMKKTFQVHRLVALTFNGPPKDKDMVVDHINENREDNRPENLEWVTVAENVRRANSINIVQLTLKGDFIKEFRDSVEAHNETKISETSISQTCRGIRRSAGGYIWMHKKDYQDGKNVKKYETKKLARPVIQFDQKGNFLAEFKSVKEASIQTKIPSSTIYGICEGKLKKTNIPPWSYKDKHSECKNGLADC